ncbi:MAG: Maf family protein [Ruminococcus sp.]|nr:Maf family protein [Ruminococcus sp.]
MSYAVRKQLRNKKVILASASPRRKELMRFLVNEFEIIPAFGDEVVPKDMNPQDVPVHLAKLKCSEVAKRCMADDNTVVIGCDTVVSLKDKIFGKPKNNRDALNMLRQLQGETHYVYSGVCVFYKGELYTMLGSTAVSFYPASDDELEEYIKTGEPMGKAGAYAIQGFGGLLVKSIDGDYNNVVGLPVSLLAQRLAEIIDE